MASRKRKKTGSRSTKKTSAKAPAPLVATPANALASGWASVVRRIGSISDPMVASLPMFPCDQSLLSSIYFDPDGPDIVALRIAIGSTPLQVAGATFTATRTALDAKLNAFNLAHATTFTIDGNCSQPNHVTSGSGCRPGFGHTYSLSKGNPPDGLFGTCSSGALIVGYGYVISVDFSV